MGTHIKENVSWAQQLIDPSQNMRFSGLRENEIRSNQSQFTIKQLNGWNFERRKTRFMNSCISGARFFMAFAARMNIE